MRWVREVVGRYNLASLDVVEIGSYDVNGSVRELFGNAPHYLGVDMRPGPGVDRVANVEDLVALVDAVGARWPVVVSTEMLEHTPRPWVAVGNMAALLSPGGYLVLTTRGPGFGLHEHPGDFYRFTPPAIAVLLADLGLGVRECVEDPDCPGVFAVAQSGRTYRA